MTTTKIFEAEMDYYSEYHDVEDGGCAQIYNLFDPEDHDDDGMFIRIQSWSNSSKHPEMDKLVGKRIRVTVEIVD